jgi:hypothetical protein
MILSTSLLLALAVFSPDAPLRHLARADAPDPLAQARKLSAELRYEEAVVEYQRFLGESGRPTAERARALLELGFLHHVLGDEPSAEARAFEALEQDGALRLPPEAPSRLEQFLGRMRERFEARPVLELLPPLRADAPDLIRARVTDRDGKVKRVLLRHAMASTGPFYSQTMRCEGELCEARIPPPQGAAAYTAWYYVEANDAEGNTVGRGASPGAPLRVSIVDKAPWYSSPWVYAGGAAALIGGAAVFFALSEPAR